ncbi:Uma2 family endonuclease [Tunturibacter empetritectus]|uniref:Uma2 family endonuclease n=1 Tax=Tunturiibacter lichenicola TaxID=2051959 RepID=A0A7W8N4I0_9BACT|nr:Uma2 family endonuclease [Edaphobacter lichenicola]MBB5344538.1 Uma2 family endonuclease [Edaphobacter lichenicola]
MNSALAGKRPPFRFRPETPMSDEDLMHFCAANDIARVEREVDGEILVMSPAGNRTGRRNAAIISALDTWAQKDGRGYVFDSSTGFTLPDGSMRSPDAAWIEAFRWNALSRADQDRFSPICPDFLIELRSPSDELAALEWKMARWITNGAKLAWLIDPEREVVGIYRPDIEPEILHQPSLVQGAGIIDGFTLNLARIWR